MPNNLYQLLDAGLAQVQHSDLSLDQLKAKLPEGQQELQSLLLLAHSLQALSPASPKPDYIQTSRVRIWNRIRSKLRDSEPAATSRKPINVLWRRALAGGLLALALVFSGLGVASASALPGDALYNLKRGFESVQMAFATSPSQEAGLLAQFAQERIQEIEALSQLNRPDYLAQALDEYTQTMDDFISITSSLDDDWDDDLVELQDMFSNNTLVLQAVQDRVPEDAQDAIEQAIERSSHGQAVLETLQQGGHPSDLAPGLQDPPNNHQFNQPHTNSNIGNAYGRNKDKSNGRSNSGNHGRGNANGRNNDNHPGDPQDED